MEEVMGIDDHDYSDGDQCPICGQGVLRKREMTETFVYKGETLVITGCVAYRCLSCKHGFYGKETSARIGAEAEKLIAGVRVKKLV
jgi:YgiT-type zinc finger domain-containing protein